MEKLEGVVDITALLGPGVYLLILRGEVVYVGQSQALWQRIYTHRHNATKKVPFRRLPYGKILFDAVQVIPCHIDQLRGLEKDMILLFKPRHNERMKPKAKPTLPLELRRGPVRVTLNGPKVPPLTRRPLCPGGDARPTGPQGQALAGSLWRRSFANTETNASA